MFRCETILENVQLALRDSEGQDRVENTVRMKFQY